MKERKLIHKYIPADYSDCFSRCIKAREAFTVDTLFNMMFCDFPWPVRMLFKIRNAIVKPFGLKGGISFKEHIIERNPEEIIVGMDDKHLSFWASVYCSAPVEGCQTVAVTTVVRFNNLLGRLYFSAIWLFHKLLVGSLCGRLSES
jgi:hypothetical protein